MSDTSEAYDYALLDQMLEKVKGSVFFNAKRAHFYAPLMCSLDFVWSTSHDTAATDGETIWWSPAYFLKLPDASRQTDLMHELGHVARLHMLRRDDRDPKLWNIACDIKIDLDLEADGYTFEGIEGVLTWSDLNARQYFGKAEEEIYDDLVQRGYLPPPMSPQDIKFGGKAKQMAAAQAVIRAMHQAKLSGGAGSIPGDTEEIISKFLAPVVPWEMLLQRWMTDLSEPGYSWKRRNKRFRSVYLPSPVLDAGKLDHLAYYEDTSGSISSQDVLRFNSEVKFVKEQFKPALMTLVQFDTKIQQIKVFEEDDPFDEIKVVGRGGTSLVPVHKHIIDTKPTAAIIFSDLCCDPMKPLPFDIPVLWVCIRNKKATVPFGKLIHIR